MKSRGRRWFGNVLDDGLGSQIFQYLRRQFPAAMHRNDGSYFTH